MSPHKKHKKSCSCNDTCCHICYIPGPTGATGPQGNTGNTGSTGPQGNTGTTGILNVFLDGANNGIELKIPYDTVLLTIPVTVGPNQIVKLEAFANLQVRSQDTGTTYDSFIRVTLRRDDIGLISTLVGHENLPILQGATSNSLEEGSVVWVDRPTTGTYNYIFDASSTASGNVSAAELISHAFVITLIQT